MTLISNDFEYKIPVYSRRTDNLLELFPTKFDQQIDMFPSMPQIKAIRIIIKF